MQWVVTGTRRSRSDTMQRLSYHAALYGKPSHVIVGGDESRGERKQRGVDKQVSEWCKENGVPCTVVYALWDELGKAAGPKRNGWMAAKTKPGDHCVALPDSGSVGTWDCLKQCTHIDIGCLGFVYPEVV